MVKVIMGIGIPGSGKSTTLKPFAEKNSYIYISPDDIRKEFTGDVSNQSKNKEVWQEAYRRVEESLKEDKTVVFDATFAKDLERKNFINFVREKGAEKVQGVFTNVPFEIASERNNNRDRVVPQYAMQRIHKMLTENPPNIEDGFDSIFYLNENQELTFAEIKNQNDTINHEFGPKIR